MYIKIKEGMEAYAVRKQFYCMSMKPSFSTIFLRHLLVKKNDYQFWACYTVQKHQLTQSLFVGQCRANIGFTVIYNVR